MPTASTKKAPPKGPRNRPPTKKAIEGRIEHAARVRQLSMLAIIAGLRRGYTQAAAAAAGRVTYKAMREWMLDEGQYVDLPERLDGQGAVVEPASRVQFGDAVLRAMAEAKMFYEDTVRRAATEAEKVYHYDAKGNLLREVVKYDWRAAAWWLERAPQSREDWKPPQTKTELTGPGGGAMQIEHSGVVTFKPDERWLADYRAGLDALPPAVVEVIEGEAIEVTKEEST